MRTAKWTLVVLAAATLASSASAGVLWDNNLTPDGVNGRALSPPAFPDIRVADDFVVPDGTDWVIGGFRAGIIEDSGWTPGDRLELFVYEDSGGVGPGDEIFHITGDFARIDKFNEYFGRTHYQYSMESLDIPLGPGTYWIGLRNPDGGGSGTNYWLTSDGGPDGAGSSTGYLSLDGITWQAEGEGWHHAFEITGVPEPGGLALLAIGAVAILPRRR